MLLLRYPATHQQEESKGSSSMHHINLLLAQALTLQMSPTAQTGASVVAENWNVLHIPVEVPEPPPSIKRRPGHQKMATSESRPRPSEYGRLGLSHGPIGVSEMIAKSLIERGESL